MFNLINLFHLIEFVVIFVQTPIIQFILFYQINLLKDFE